MKHHHLASLVIVSASLSIAALTIAAQEAVDVTSPNGIALSEFKGYQSWEVIAPSVSKDGVKTIVGNPLMIRAYKDGLVAGGKPVPDGAVMAKFIWSAKDNALLPGAARVPDTLTKVQFMVKDAKRFPDTDGWGYADFHYDGESGTFRGVGNGPGFAKTACHQCHTRVKTRDFVFTEYAKR
jgi:hypothetical protein